MEYFSR